MTISPKAGSFASAGNGNSKTGIERLQDVPATLDERGNLLSSKGKKTRIWGGTGDYASGKQWLQHNCQELQKYPVLNSLKLSMGLNDGEIAKTALGWRRSELRRIGGRQFPDLTHKRISARPGAGPLLREKDMKEGEKGFSLPSL